MARCFPVRAPEITSVVVGVTELDNVWIEMDDGCRLAARIWLPASGEGKPADPRDLV